MKTSYILILEFEAEIKEKISIVNKKKKKYYNLLLKEALRNDKLIRALYQLCIITDLRYGNYIYEIDEDFNILNDRDEIEIIRPVLQSLPDDAKEYFLRIFETKDERRDEFFEIFFSQFKTLKVKKANFMIKSPEKNQ
jgi:hypothetical protein